MSATRDFSFEAVLQVAVPVLVTSMDDVYDLIGFVLRDPGVTTYGLVISQPKVAEFLEEQFPGITSISYEGGSGNQEEVQAWADSVRSRLGYPSTLTVRSFR